MSSRAMTFDNFLCINTEGTGQEARATFVPCRATQIPAGGIRPQPLRRTPVLGHVPRGLCDSGPESSLCKSRSCVAHKMSPLAVKRHHSRICSGGLKASPLPSRPRATRRPRPMPGPRPPRPGPLRRNCGDSGDASPGEPAPQAAGFPDSQLASPAATAGVPPEAHRLSSR